MDEAIKELVKRLRAANYSDQPEWTPLEVPLDEAADAIEALAGEVERLRADKDGAYSERNQLVAFLTRCFPSWRARTDIPGWMPEWHGCVYIETPEGQLSWHYHDREAGLFEHLDQYPRTWDGHTTEDKYQRLARLQPNTAERDELANWKASFLHENEQILASNAQLAAERDRLKAAIYKAVEYEEDRIKYDCLCSDCRLTLSKIGNDLRKALGDAS